MGNGELTLGEQRAHFALWSLYKSPLLIGADLRACGGWGQRAGAGAACRGCRAAHGAALARSPPARPCAGRINPDSLAVLLAEEVIAVNQDPLGVPGDLIWAQGASRVRGGEAAGAG